MSVLVLAAEGHGETAANTVVEAAGGAVGLAFLIPLLPLLGFVTILFASRRFGLREAAALIAIGTASLSFVLSVAVFVQVLGEPATYVRPLFTWMSVGGFDVAYDLYVDQLTAVMLLVVTGVGSLVHVYSVGYMHEDPRYARFFAYLNLFLFSMLTLVLGANFLTLFLGWELVGLSSYLLIGFWFEDMENAVAAKKAFITNRVGDVSFMVGMFLIFAVFGSLAFTDVFPEAGGLSSGQALAISLLLLGGAAAKSAQIPLYVWLPDAMAGPTPVSALIHAATMVTAGVYLMVRAAPILIGSVGALTIVAWIGVLTALLAALIAIRQDDIKKILAYSTVSQLGYMFVGVGTGGFREGIFHLVTHAFFKGLLFLAAGSVMHAMANQVDAWRMGGLRSRMPVTFWTSAVATLAIAGFPPLAGFYSKDTVLAIAYEHGFVGVWAVGVLVAVLTAFYMGRWFLLIFWGQPRWTEGQRIVDPHGHGEVELHPHESPSTMTTPLIVLAVLSVIGGFALNGSLKPGHDGPIFSWLAPVAGAIPEEFEGLELALGEGALVLISIAAALLGLTAAWFAYGRRDLRAGRRLEPVRGVGAELLERRFFVDDLYDRVFVRGGGAFANAMTWFDAKVVDGLVNGAGAVSVSSGRQSRRWQTGLVRGYLASVVLGAVVIVGVLLVRVG